MSDTQIETTEAGAPAIAFTPQQDAAMAAVRDWLTTRSQPVFRLFGYAGTGKTTLAKSLAKTVKGKVLFAAFTGKAASVMRSKGCDGASTIHRLIYKPAEDDHEKIEALRSRIIEGRGTAAEQVEWKRALEELLKPKFELGASQHKRAALIVIDECSMVDERMGRDLMALGVPILVLGDPAQLPPVGGGGFFTNQAPDFLLDQIHRQVGGSGILKLATEVRERRVSSLRQGTYGDESSCVSDLAYVSSNCDPLWFDQILVGFHPTRRLWNRRVRALRGYVGTDPVPGDKLVCMRNDHDNEILNGTLWTCREAHQIDARDRMTLTVESDEGEVRTVTAIRHLFQGREEELTVRPVQGTRFDFGYALTVHKAQGSQFDRVLVINEAKGFGRFDSPDTPWRWLYTAITRSAKVVVVAQ